MLTLAAVPTADLTTEQVAGRSPAGLVRTPAEDGTTCVRPVWVTS